MLSQNFNRCLLATLMLACGCAEHQVDDGPKAVTATSSENAGSLEKSKGEQSLASPQRRSYPMPGTQTAVPVGNSAWFVDRTVESGIAFRYSSGKQSRQFTILETVGGGVGMFDFDQDGDLDLIFPGGGTIAPGEPLQVAGRPVALYRNNGHAHFEDCSDLLDSTAGSFYSHGAFVCDYDRDGDPDVLITGFRKCALFRNEAGLRFTNVTEQAKLTLSDWATAAAWADLNRDGWPDLLIVSYLDWDAKADPTCGDRSKGTRDACPPNQYPTAKQRVCLNQKDGTFKEVPTALEGSAQGKGLGVVATDLNDDGWVDFYVANDQIDNQLYLGGPEFPFKEVGALSSTSGNEYGIPEGSMGVDAGDYDGDGRADLFVANYQLEDNSLYQNQGQNLFRHTTAQAGLGGISRPLVKFGTGFADFDLDGWLDLFLINGHVLYETGQSPYLQPSLLLRNVEISGQRRFRDVTQTHGGPWFQERYAGRGAAVGDLDNDGDLDLIVVQQDAPVAVLLNQLNSESAPTGKRNPANWISLDVRGTTSEPSAVGAVVTYRYQNRSLVRHIRSGAGYLSQFDQRILLPVTTNDLETVVPSKDVAQKVVSDNPATGGGPSTLEVTVRWLTGRRERFSNLKPGQTNRIEEGRGESL